MREPVDDILMYHLKRYLCELSEDGKYVAKINITFIVLDYYRFIIVFSVIVIIFLSFSPSLFLSPPSPLSHYQIIIISNLIMYYEILLLLLLGLTNFCCTQQAVSIQKGSRFELKSMS